MAEENLKSLIGEMNSAWAEFKQRQEQADEEVKKLGEVSGETTQVIERLQDRLDEIDTKLARPAVSGSEESEETKEAKAYKDAFNAWARKGDKAKPEHLTLLNQKALTLQDDTSGGYLASDEMVQEIIKNVVEFSPIRTIARVRPTSQRTVKIRKRTGSFSAAWVGESGTRSETTGLAYGLEEIPTHELYALVDISVQDLEDSDFNLESELNTEFAEQFGVAEGTAFVNGTSVNQPEGFMLGTTIDHVANTHATTLKGDGLMNLFYAVNEVYANRGYWVLKRPTLRDVRKMKDGVGQFLFEPNIALGQPATILGRPFVLATDMPAVASAAFPIAFGDYQKGYIIVDRVAINIVRDPYTQAGTGMVRFTARKRLGGQVIQSEAIQKLEMAVS